MNEKYNALFTPWKIGNVEMKNRIVMLTMENGTIQFIYSSTSGNN